LSIRIFKTLQL